jgi:soluble cytochrome b562
MTLLKNGSLILILFCSAAQLTMTVTAEEPVAAVTASTDVEATMKAMSFAYKKAMAATDVPQMQQHITYLQQRVASVQLHQFPEGKQAKFQQGLTEVQLQLDLVQASLVANNHEQAKQQLKQVDVLKKQYHKERSPSVWQLLFGN